MWLCFQFAELLQRGEDALHPSYYSSTLADVMDLFARTSRQKNSFFPPTAIPLTK